MSEPAQVTPPAAAAATPPPAAGAGAPAAAAEATPEALHDSAIAAVSAWQSEADPVKQAELKTAATAAVEAAKKGSEAFKVAAAANKAPDKYELTMPKESLLDPKHAEDVAAFAKEHKLSQAAAAKVLERENAAVAKFFENQKAEVAKTQAEWAKLNLAAVGGDEAKLGAMAEGANRVLKRFDADGIFTKELQTSGLGNNPLLLKFLNTVSQAMKDDQLVTAGAEGGDKPSTGKLLFNKSLADSASKGA